MRATLRTTPQLLAFALVVLAATGTAFALDLGYVEDFTTTTYRDPVATTARWDTEEASLGLDTWMDLAGSLAFGGPALDVAMDGDHACIVGNDGGLGYLLTIDASDPQTPAPGGMEVLTGLPEAVAIDGNWAYVAAQSSLVTVDITDPSAPSAQGFVGGYLLLMDVAVSEDRAYVVDQVLGLSILDVSDPAVPLPAGSTTLPFGSYGVAVAGDHVYVACLSTGLEVVDATDPTTPVSIGSLSLAGGAIDVAIDGDLAYLASTTAGIHVVDVTDPSAPSLLGSFDTPGTAYRVVPDGDYLYVADDDHGVHILSVADPASPFLVESWDSPGSATGLAVDGHLVYLADGDSGIHVLEAARAVASPSIVGSCQPPSRGANCVVVRGDYAYVAYVYFWTADISDPTNPARVGECTTPGAGYCVVVEGDHAYVTEGSNGFSVIDIQDPEDPVVVGNVDTPGQAWLCDVDGDHAYVADSDSVIVIDVSEPTDPHRVAGFYTTGDAHHVDVVGDLLYVATSNALLVLDVSDPESPIQVGSCTVHSRYGVAVRGNYAYVACYNDGLKVIDVTDATNPVIVGSLDTYEARGIEIAGDYALIGDMRNGVVVADISDPTSPTAVDTIYTSDPQDRARWVTVAGDYAYIADQDNGLFVAQLFERFDQEGDTGQSLALDESDEPISRYRLSAAHNDTVRWDLSFDGGTSWESAPAYGEWQIPLLPGPDLVWRTTHVYAGLGINPTCTGLALDWLYDFPVVTSVTDIPNDQGGRVRIGFVRSGRDFADEPEYPIVTYNVLRRVDDPAVRLAVTTKRDEFTAGGDCGRVEAPGDLPCVEWRGRRFALDTPNTARGGLPAGVWEVLGSFAAFQEQEYLYEATTLADSTGSGIPYAVYCVTAHSATPSVWYASLPDSGYSVDNIAPQVPGGFMVEYEIEEGNQLVWDTCPDNDFEHFRIYRGDEENFEPTEANLVHATIETSWLDGDGEGWQYYRITALDHAGNESEPTSAESATSVEENEIPRRFVLHQNAPNPMRTSTTIRFDVPVAGGEMTLEIFDVAGRHVRTLVDGRQEPGRRQVSWNGRNERGERVASGVYCCRLTADGCQETVRVALLR